jgi:hypothetical protein
MICIDNANGCGVGIAVGDDTYHVAENDGLTIYGWSPLPDGIATDKYGADIPANGGGGQSLHPPKEKKMPYTKTAGGSWAGEIRFLNNNFINFTEMTISGKSQRLFGMGCDPDYASPTYFIGNTFNNVAMNSMFTLPDPVPGWANIADCGEFPCTGPKNILLDFRDTIYQGANQPVTGSDFQVIHDNAEFAPYVSPCTRWAPWNGYWCQKGKLGVLLFESLDADKMDRSVQPIYV